ncbi:hypothetical protein V1264_024801 [Littorina saxatilis]|uniref:Uncharacterized protein n=1 Tax=Littorina saxatilis TaxID=31220 RepID=A0AAN9ALW3_9CAEN
MHAETVHCKFTSDDRFVGPATTVEVHCNIPQRWLEVRTEGQAVAELGYRFARMILTIQQLDLMNRNPPHVYITGPPGTGKTLMLVLQGLRWIHQGHPVHIISTHPGTRTICNIIKDQLEETLCARHIAPPTICIHDCNFLQNDEDVTKVVTNVSNSAQDGKVHVIVDEGDFNKRKDYGPRAERAIKELIQLLPNACLWVAGIWDQDIPAELQKETLTIPLRCAPAVLREVEPALKFYTDVNAYSTIGVPSPGDGLNSIRLCHHGTDHTGRWPVDCEQCGQDVADMLQNRLRVGGKDGSIKMSDVFILTRSMELQDEFKDQAGNLTSSASGFVRGLRAAGLLVDVLGVSLGTKDLATWKTETANMRSSSSNKITVAHWNDVQGTERKVVVWLKCKTPDDENRLVADLNDRLHIVSRCTTQLIVVDLPPDSSVSQ